MSDPTKPADIDARIVSIRSNLDGGSWCADDGRWLCSLAERLAEQHKQDAEVVARLKGERDTARSKVIVDERDAEEWRRVAMKEADAHGATTAERNKLRWDLARLSESHARLLEALVEYGVHQFPCPFAQFCGGRPTTDGGYETRYGEKWYPRGQEPECTCGLKDAIAATEKGGQV